MVPEELFLPFPHGVHYTKSVAEVNLKNSLFYICKLGADGDITLRNGWMWWRN